MSTVNRLYNFQAGQKIYSQQVDDEFNQLVDAHNVNDGRLVEVENKILDELATEQYVDTQITQAMLGNPPLGGVTLEMLDSDIQYSLSTVDKGMANLAILAEINGISTGQSGYGYDLFTGPGNNLYSSAKMDITRARVGASIALGTSSVSISDLTGGSFTIGQEVTLQDVVTDSITERKVISNVSGSIITFNSPTTKAYAANANIYRSLANVDPTNKKLEFGAAVYPGATITATGTATVSATNNITYDNGPSRRTVRTARGWLVHATSTNTNAHSLYISKDGGLTWAILCTNTANSLGGSGEIGVYGDTVYWCLGVGQDGAYLYAVDTINQANVDIKLFNKKITERRFSGNAAMAIDSKGFIHVTVAISGLGEDVWVYCVSKDGGNTFTSTDVAMYSGYSSYNFILIDKNDNAVFLIQDGSSPYNIIYASKVGNVYRTSSIGMTGTSVGYTAIVKRSGSNIGRMFVVSTTGGVMYSDDNGVTWATGTAMGVTTAGGQMSENANGDVFCIYRDTGSTIKTISCLNGTTTWVNNVSYEASAATSTLIAALEYGGSFTVPISIYNKTGTQLTIRGTYTPILSKDVTQVDVRYNITPPTGTMEELRSWISYDDFTGFTVVSAFSSVNPGAAEAFVTMTTDNTDYGSTIETYYEGSVPVAKARNTQRITMTRSLPSENRGITKYLAALIAP